MNTSKKMMVIVMVMLMLMLMSGCATAPPARQTQAELKVIAEPATTRVFIDDRFITTAQVLQARPHTLATGKHQLTFEADGYFPHDMDIELPPGQTTIQISLRPVPL